MHINNTSVTCKKSFIFLFLWICLYHAVDVFLLSAGIGKQNAALQSGIELATAETNVLGFIRMVDTAYVCCMWMRFPASGGAW